MHYSIWVRVVDVCTGGLAAGAIRVQTASASRVCGARDTRREYYIRLAGVPLLGARALESRPRPRLIARWSWLTGDTVWSH